MSKSCPHRCFLIQVPEKLLQNQHSLRLMGLAVSWKESTLSSEYIEITLDDGTALLPIHVPQYMITRCKASAYVTMMGKMLDCILHAERRGESGGDGGVQNNLLSSTFALYANQITIIDDDPHAELLRWFELSVELPSHVSTSRGFPLPALTSEDVLDIIQLESSSPEGGVSMEDLVIFFELDQGIIEDLLSELQLSGQVYRNQQGNYLPL